MSYRKKVTKDIKRYLKEVAKNIKRSGYHLIAVEDTGYLPGFVYSIGLHQTYRHPELILFGLSNAAMSALLHALAHRIKAGEQFVAEKDYMGVVENFPVQFLPIKKEHYVDYLGFAGNYYNFSFDFPALQIVWTDNAGHYPWQDGFFPNWKFKQPLLDRNIDFKFYEERNLGVFTTQQVLAGQPILYVRHAEEGDWQFLHSSHVATADIKLVSLGNLVNLDSSLNKLYYLHYGQTAYRKNSAQDWFVE